MQDALSSGCIQGITADGMPSLHNDRPIMVANDTHAYDLHMLAPVGPNGWVFLGDTARYVAVSSKRFASVAYLPQTLAVQVVGAKGEAVRLVALKPKPSPAAAPASWLGSGVSAAAWDVVVRTATIISSSTAVEVTFS